MFYIIYSYILLIEKNIIFIICTLNLLLNINNFNSYERYINISFDILLA